MTVEEVNERVQKIKDAVHAEDDETAHEREDQLHRAVLKAIAEGADDPRGLAKAALATLDLDFARWCA